MLAKPSSCRHGFLILIFAERLVRVAIQPTLAGLRGGDDRVLGSMRVLGRVAIRRAIAAQCDAALLAAAQMHPLRADLHAFSAFRSFWVFDRINRVEMRTASVRH